MLLMPSSFLIHFHLKTKYTKYTFENSFKTYLEISLIIIIIIFYLYKYQWLPGNLILPMGNNKLLHWTPYNFSFCTALSTMYIKQGFHISLTVSYKHLISALKFSFPSINNLSPGKFIEFAVHCIKHIM